MEEYGDIFLTKDEAKALVNEYIDNQRFLVLPMFDDLKKIIEGASKIRLNNIYLDLVMDKEFSIDIVEGKLVFYPVNDPDNFVHINN